MFTKIKLKYFSKSLLSQTNVLSIINIIAGIFYVIKKRYLQLRHYVATAAQNYKTVRNYFSLFISPFRFPKKITIFNENN